MIVRSKKLASLFTAVALMAFYANARADHAPLPEGVTPIAATWLWGHHIIPGNITKDGSPYRYAYPHTDPKRINDPPWTEVAARHIKEGAKAPAVVILHGCSGLIRGSVGFRLLLLEEGFALFEPDAYARPGHSCETSSPGKRVQEADYALERIRELPWIDQQRVVLMGYSEGGRAIALRDEPGFAAHVILMAPARSTGPGDVPILSVAGSKDSYAKPEAYHAVASSDAHGSKAVLIPDQGHDILAHPEFKEALRKFLREVLR